MGSSKGCDSTFVHSSIALLQERFRRLEKAKEMRQHRELLRLISEEEQINPITVCEQPKRFFHSELILPPRPPLQGHPDFQPERQNKHIDPQATETPNLTDLWHENKVAHGTHNFDDSDVDTSLHL
ncbi:hypothetical protein HS088_TW21G00602 [Tripterygium wilfordii]|uniref:Uncharacterized protein n=1 Tax=Tripterygium wilfordii TaxID=458696 RepID=A0A7J7C3F3_TRIWF|nr:hypothetical protein HS088_TW21G00602 [Tripterygium wilfordii]